MLKKECPTFNILRILLEGFTDIEVSRFFMLDTNVFREWYCEMLLDGYQITGLSSIGVFGQPTLIGRKLFMEYEKRFDWEGTWEPHPDFWDVIENARG